MCVLHTSKVEVQEGGVDQDHRCECSSTWMIAPLLFAQASQSAIDHHVNIFMYAWYDWLSSRTNELTRRVACLHLTYTKVLAKRFFKNINPMP
jgi:hypothetical protein